MTAVKGLVSLGVSLGIAMFASILGSEVSLIDWYIAYGVTFLITNNIDN